MVELIELVGERLDLLHLVVDHLDELVRLSPSNCQAAGNLRRRTLARQSATLFGSRRQDETTRNQWKFCAHKLRARCSSGAFPRACLLFGSATLLPSDPVARRSGMR